MPTYAKCEPKSGVKALADSLIAKHHHELAEAKVTILWMFAYALRDDNGDPKGPALKKNGWPALAVIKITSLKDRVAGLADAVCLIDGDAWPTLPDDRRASLLDHECFHLEVKKDETGGVIGDDAGRPKLKIRLHDFECCGFHDIVERHGQSAAEATAVAKVHAEWLERKLIQGTFHWG